MRFPEMTDFACGDWEWGNILPEVAAELYLSTLMRLAVRSRQARPTGTYTSGGRGWEMCKGSKLTFHLRGEHGKPTVDF